MPLSFSLVHFLDCLGFPGKMSGNFQENYKCLYRFLWSIFWIVLDFQEKCLGISRKITNASIVFSGTFFGLSWISRKNVWEFPGKLQMPLSFSLVHFLDCLGFPGKMSGNFQEN